MKFFVDMQLPPALAEQLWGRGFDAVHVRDVGLGAASDILIAAYAVQYEAVVVTKDEDFVRYVPAATARVVWIRIGNCRNAALLARIDGSWEAIVERLKAGEKLVELR